MATYEFPVHSLRTFTEDTGKRFLAKVPVASLPPNLPLEVNAREQNLRTGVAKAIRRSLLDRPDIFHLLNRGIVVTAKYAKYDQDTSTLSLLLDDKELHGVLDGGHTYRILVESRDSIASESIPAFVTMEILTGMEEYVADIVDARNTSVQVDAASLANIQDRFDPILDWLKSHGIARDRIRVKQFDNAEIPILDILSIMYVFDTDTFGSGKQGTSLPPMRAYSGKAQVLKHVLDPRNLERYTYKMLPLLPDILWLWDFVALRVQEHYRMGVGRPEGRFGRRRGNQSGDQPGTFMPQVTVPMGVHPAYRFPLIAAMRCLVDPSGDQYRWCPLPSSIPSLSAEVRELLQREPTDVERFYNWVAPDLMRVLAGELDTSTPNKIGKSDLVWNAMYTQAWLKLD